MKSVGEMHLCDVSKITFLPLPSLSALWTVCRSCQNRVLDLTLVTMILICWASFDFLMNSNSHQARSGRVSREKISDIVSEPGLTYFQQVGDFFLLYLIAKNMDEVAMKVHDQRYY